MVFECGAEHTIDDDHCGQDGMWGWQWGYARCYLQQGTNYGSCWGISLYFCCQVACSRGWQTVVPKNLCRDLWSLSFLHIVWNLLFPFWSRAMHLHTKLITKPRYSLLQTRNTLQSPSSELLHLSKSLVAFPCWCISVNSVKNTRTVILQAIKGNVPNIESAFACKADAKFKYVYTSNNIATSSSVG